MWELQQLIEDLSAWELTIREQARTPENDPTLTYPVFFPQNDVNSVDLAEITILDVRYIGDRREWNADGRHIPAKRPPAKFFSMVPLEAYFQLGEYEMQKLQERFNGNREMILAAAHADIDSRVTSLTTANVWAAEYESLRAWAENKIVVMNPQTGKVYEASMQIDSARYATDTTPWTDSNAYDRLLGYIDDAIDQVGAIEGIRVRRDIARKIQKSAPRLLVDETRMTLRQAQDRIGDEIGSGFRIEIDERSVEKFTGAGDTTTMTKLWPDNKIAFIPAGNRVGSLNRAPQFRAQDLPQIVANFDGFDARGQRVYFSPLNEGKSLKVQAQWNALAIPDEQRVFVVDITQG